MARWIGDTLRKSSWLLKQQLRIDHFLALSPYEDSQIEVEFDKIL